ncbi:EamA family transporter [Erwinia sp. CPCC 100877]|nr:EamA family transporter [Erwinia sp. CPCC 100877]
MKRTLTGNGNLIGIAGGLLLSADSLFIRMMGIDNSWAIVLLRGLFMWAVCLLVWLMWRPARATLGAPRVTRDNLLSVLFFCLASAGFVNALNRGNVATVLVIISATPFISALLSRMIFGARMDRGLLTAALFGMVGVAIVMSGRGGHESGLANLFALGTAASMALAFIYSSRVQGGTLALPSVGGLLAALLVGVFAGVPVQQTLTQMNGAQWGWALAEGALVMPLAMGLITLSTRYVSPANAGLFLLLETALAPLWIWLVLGQAPTGHALIGGVIIVGAVLVNSLRSRRAELYDEPQS